MAVDYIFITDSDSDLPYHLKEQYDIPVIYSALWSELKVTTTKPWSYLLVMVLVETYSIRVTN